MANHPVEIILARQLGSQLAVPAMLVDTKGTPIWFNEPAELIFGIRYDEVDALSAEERATILAPCDARGRPVPQWELPGTVAMRERRPVQTRLRVQGPDGELRPVEATGIPLESVGGQLLGAVVLLWAPGAAPDRPGT